MPDQVIPELVNEKQIREFFVPIAPRTLARWQSSGQFPKPDVRIGAKVRLWRSATIRAWITARLQERAA